MQLFELEHGKTGYRADFVLYGTVSALLAAYLAMATPPALRLGTLAWALIGLAGWTLVEYALHRFVLHGLRPFSTWHAEHHHRPAALICTPTIVSATLIALLVWLPAVLLGGRWRATALTLGLLIGYFAYAITHHATHHWRAHSAWALRRKRWHAQHHNPASEPGHYGVTTGFWDHVFRSDGRVLP